MEAVLSSLVSARGGKWIARSAGGVLAFWCVGVIALSNKALRTVLPPCGQDQVPLLCGVRGNQGLFVVAVIVLALVLAIGASSLVIALTPAVLLLIAGYGSLWRSRLGRAWTEVHLAWHRRRRNRVLADYQAGDRNAAARLVWYPTGEQALRPTRAGNAFAALAQRVTARHGLDLPSCWPLLEQASERMARQDLEKLSERLDNRIINLLWTLLTIAWIPLLPQRLGLALAAACLVIAIFLWLSISSAVEQYCSLVEALVVVQRHRMYRAAGWPAPTSVLAEPALGRCLTAYLTRRGNQEATKHLPGVQLSWPDVDDA
jgi:hypothetical protein